MGFFNLFSSAPKRFVSELDFRRNLSKQTTMTPMTLGQLRKLGVTDETKLRLEYFFYTDSPDKAAPLVNALKGKGYEVRSKPSVSDKNQQIITGWTSKMEMSDEVVVAWTKDMCELGFSFDCDFDGWGTNPHQSE